MSCYQCNYSLNVCVLKSCASNCPDNKESLSGQHTMPFWWLVRCWWFDDSMFPRGVAFPSYIRGYSWRRICFDRLPKLTLGVDSIKIIVSTHELAHIANFMWPETICTIIRYVVSGGLLQNCVYQSYTASDAGYWYRYLHLWSSCGKLTSICQTKLTSGLCPIKLITLPDVWLPSRPTLPTRWM